MRRAGRIAVAWALVLATASAPAWDTDTQKETLGWHSVYVGNDRASSLPFSGFTSNEHSELAHITLAAIGAACFGIAPSSGGGCSTTVVDLNAALYRPELLGLHPAGQQANGDDPTTLLEERWLPPPAHFAGLPDYSYSVHDWINKNTLCPPLPPDAPDYDECYLFAGWMGKFNANHFGTQARHSYERFHRIALALAARARGLREHLGEHSPADTAYADYLREAELEALVYEGVGQHFFQDRWSMGHMWERWNAADYPGLADSSSTWLSSRIAGLIHGSEGVTGLPDPMCSPRTASGPFGSTAVPVEWRLAGFPPEPGVGDYRLEDMFDGLFGFDFGLGDLPLDVLAQRQQMLDCLAAGWAEVIRAFGETEPGRYGVHRTPVVAAARSPVLDDLRCWEVWATNDAMIAGWAEHPALTRIDGQARGEVVGTAVGVDAARTQAYWLVPLSWKIEAARHFADPDDVTLARFEIGALGHAQTGDAYAFAPGGAHTVAEYIEPADLDSLPDSSSTYGVPRGAVPGMDKRAVFGFFNRSHADYWCERSEAVLASLRDGGGPLQHEACAYLAERLYRGTDPSYRGAQTEQRMVGDTPLEPICGTFGVTTTGVDPDLPYYLHPGYVAAPGARDEFSYDSVVAWCRRLPVVEAAPTCDGAPPDDGGDDWDVVGRIEEGGGVVVLAGRDFGDAGGEVWAAAAPGATSVVELFVESWADTEIRLDVQPEQLAEGQWFLQVRPFDVPGRNSVGRFILRVGDRQCLPASLVGSWILRGVGLPNVQFSFHLLDDGSVMFSFVGRSAWVSVGQWTVSGDTINIMPCATPNFDSLVFEGTWTADAEADGFGVRSCPGSVQGPCPAMRGTYTHVFSDGSTAGPWPVDSTAGYTSGNRLEELFGEMWDCHGGCGQYWANLFRGPGPCGPL